MPRVSSQTPASCFLPKILFITAKSSLNKCLPSTIVRKTTRTEISKSIHGASRSVRLHLPTL